MYGLVNRAIQELIEQNHGEAAWLRIAARTGLDGTQPFLAMASYEDALTYGLIEAASEVLETPVPDLLEAFGRHWVLFTAAEGYGDLLDLAGDTLETFLDNLDATHARLAASLPELRPPSFQTERLDSGATRLHYRSERPGLGPMVLGLLHGLADRFDRTVEIEWSTKPTEAAHYAIFDIRSSAR